MSGGVEFFPLEQRAKIEERIAANLAGPHATNFVQAANVLAEMIPVGGAILFAFREQAPQIVGAGGAPASPKPPEFLLVSRPPVYAELPLTRAPGKKPG